MTANIPNSRPLWKSAAFQRRLSPPLIAFLLAVLLFLLSSFLFSNGAGLQPMADRGFNILRISAFLGVIAAGQTIVILSGGEGIDLSVGTTVTVGAMVAAVVANRQDSMVFPALFAALGVGLLIGLANGIGVAKLKVHPLVMTLGMAGVTAGGMLAIYQGQVQGGASPMMLRLISFPVFMGLSGAVLIWILGSILMWLLLNRTHYGKNLYAVGINRETAYLSGVNVPLTIIIAYTLSGLIAAFGGFLLLGYTQTVYFTLGEAYLFPSIAAVVIGGTTLAGGEGSYWGTMSGALVLTIIDSILTTVQMSQQERQIILGVILLLVIAVYGRQRALRQ
jgi:ribose transport system permease protein